jgi:copper homeostasis protein
MVRPRGGDFVYSDAEFESMRREIDRAKQLGVNGVVLGILTRSGAIDVERTRQLVEWARPLPVTFHRAFDACADLRKSLEDVIQAGATRVLSSGGATTAHEGLSVLAELVAAAGDRVIVMPGSGINPSNVARIAEQTRAREFHSGLSSVPLVGDSKSTGFEAEVRKLAKVLNGSDETTY